MLKRVMTLVCAVLLWTNVGFAEAQWEYVGASDFYNEYQRITYHNEYFIDTKSINKVQMGINEIIKAKIKVINQAPNEYSIEQYWVNNDTKQSKLAFVEKYIDGKLKSQSDYRNQTWNNYDQNDIIINEILKRAN